MTTIYMLTGRDGRQARVRRYYTTDQAARDAIPALVLGGGVDGWGTPITIEPVELHGVVALDPVPATQAATETEPAGQPDDPRANLLRIVPGPWRIENDGAGTVCDANGHYLLDVTGAIATLREDGLIASLLVDLVNRPDAIPPLVQAVVDAARGWVAWVGESTGRFSSDGRVLYDSVRALDTAGTKVQS